MKLGAFVSDYTLTADTFDRIKVDGIILVMNGVYHASIKGSPVLEKTSALYALSEDLQARGIPEADLDKRVKVVDYNGLVDVIFNDFEKIAWL
jgi:sulfur relay protein TusB/DsrH